MTSIRSAEQAIAALSMGLGVAADRLADEGVGRGSHGLFLGAGRAVGGAAARREARRSATTAALDRVGTAVADGLFGAAHVDLFARAANRLGPDRRHELNNADLVAAAGQEPVDVFARRIHRFVDLVQGDHGNADSEAKRQASSWRSWFDERTGMGHIHGEFDPERFEAIRQSVDAHATRLANHGGRQRTLNLSAEAAFELLTGEGSGTAGIPHISVVVDWKTFADRPHAQSIRETAGGLPLAAHSIARLACHAVVQRVVVDDRGVPVNVGRANRTATAAQWVAVRAIYRSCAWAGCQRPLSWCQLHHVHEWEHGGPTDLCNLVPLCTEHHHQVHEGGWSLKLWSDRRLDAHSPDGVLQQSSYPNRRAGLPLPPRRPGSQPRVAATTRRPGTRQPQQPAGP